MVEGVRDKTRVTHDGHLERTIEHQCTGIQTEFGRLHVILKDPLGHRDEWWQAKYTGCIEDHSWTYGPFPVNKCPLCGAALPDPETLSDWRQSQLCDSRGTPLAGKILESTLALIEAGMLKPYYR